MSKTFTVLRVTVDQEVVEADDEEEAARIVALKDPADVRTMYVREGTSRDEGDWFELARELVDSYPIDPAEAREPR